jgi:hypothetical protein
MQAGKAGLHLQSAMTAESYSSKINELYVSVQTATGTPSNFTMK